MKSGYVTLLGFMLLVLGFLSILFSLIGLQFSFLKFITELGPAPALGIQVIMLFGGVILMYVSRMPSEEEE